MKIIIANRFFAPDQSATSRMATSLASGLAAAGFEVEAIASATFHDQPDKRLPRTDRINGVNVVRVGGTRFGRAGVFGRALDYASFHIAAAWRLLLSASAGDVCIVCTDPPLMSVTALPVLAFKGVHLVNWLNDLFPEVAFEAGLMRPESPTGRLALALRDLSLHRAAVNVAPIERMAERLRARGAPAERVAVVHHWSEGEILTPMASGDSQLRAEWNLKDEFVVGYSGNLGRAHDFTTLLDAAERLKARADIRFLVVGGGHRLGWVVAEVARRRLSNVLIKPLQPEAKLRDCLAAADVHFVTLLPEFEASIVPSKFYGIAAAGRPTLFVGDTQGEVARQVADGVCGASFSVGAADALAATIEAYAADPSLVEAMGANARALFDARFSRSHGLAAWREVIAAAVSPTPKRPRARVSAAPAGKAS